jgi:hypothetical protein
MCTSKPMAFRNARWHLPYAGNIPPFRTAIGRRYLRSAHHRDGCQHNRDDHRDLTYAQAAAHGFQLELYDRNSFLDRDSHIGARLIVGLSRHSKGGA